MNTLINPTRMELMKLRKKKEITKRGHKLLKDKQDEFIQQFIGLIKEYKQLRETIEKQVQDALFYYKITLINNKEEFISEQLNSSKIDFNINFSVQKNMGVILPLIKVDGVKQNPTYSLFGTNAAFDKLIVKTGDLLSLIINLAEVETKVGKMILEIEKSKRRVNAIESIILKEIEEQIHAIRTKLSDIERSNTIRMIKSKEIILSKEKG